MNAPTSLPPSLSFGRHTQPAGQVLKTTTPRPLFTGENGEHPNLPARQPSRPARIPSRELTMKEFGILNGLGVVGSLAAGFGGIGGGLGAILGIVGMYLVPIPVVYGYVLLQRLRGKNVQFPGVRFNPGINVAGKQHELLPAKQKAELPPAKETNTIFRENPEAGLHPSLKLDQSRPLDLSSLKLHPAIIQQAQAGSAADQMHLGTELHYSVPAWTRTKLWFTPASRRQVPEALIESYKWLYLASKQQIGRRAEMTRSHMEGLESLIGQSGRAEAKQRAQLWLAEFGPEHKPKGFLGDF